MGSVSMENPHTGIMLQPTPVLFWRDDRACRFKLSTSTKNYLLISTLNLDQFILRQRLNLRGRERSEGFWISTDLRIFRRPKQKTKTNLT